MSTVSIWLLFLAIGLGTFTLRFLFIYLFGKIEMPDWLPVSRRANWRRWPKSSKLIISMR